MHFSSIVGAVKGGAPATGGRGRQEGQADIRRTRSCMVEAGSMLERSSLPVTDISTEGDSDRAWKTARERKGGERGTPYLRLRLSLS